MNAHMMLLIDPFKNLLNAYRMILEEEHFLVETAFDPKEAPSLFDRRPFSAVIMEYLPPHENMCETVRWLKERSPEVYLLMATNAAVEEDVYEKLLSIGVDDFILKPCSPRKIIAHIKKGLKHREIDLRLRELESLNLLDPVSRQREGLIFNKTYLDRSLKQEIKRARRHRRTFSLLLIGAPPGEGAGEPVALFYMELSKLIRKFIREEDLVARSNGEVALLLPETDRNGSKALGRRLTQLIGRHASFQHDDKIHAISKTLSFQYFTYPDLFNLPASFAAAAEELRKECSRS